MKPESLPLETGKHQDHVIAHTLGTTILGYFRADDALHLLLDIGFFWTIYADAEMGLLPQSVTIAELPLSSEMKAELVADTELLHDEGRAALASLIHMTPAPVDCLVREVSLYAQGDARRILIEGEDDSLAVETSLVTGEILVLAVSEGE
jgi:hypothetical protein